MYDKAPPLPPPGAAIVYSRRKTKFGFFCQWVNQCIQDATVSLIPFGNQVHGDGSIGMNTS